MSEPLPTSGPGPAAAPSAGRAFLVYTALRLALFLVAYVVLLAVGLTGFLALGAAVLVSALLSLVLLRRQREALTAASIARAEQRRSAKAERLQRLQGDEPPA